MIGYDPREGDVVCDPRFRHGCIIARDGDTVTMDDGQSFSLADGFDPVDHDWEHEVSISVDGRTPVTTGGGIAN